MPCDNIVYIQNKESAVAALTSKILFCNIAYMEFYDTDIPEDTPRHGGAYVEQTGDAFEKDNFHLCDDDIYRGFVETKYVDSYLRMQQGRSSPLPAFIGLPRYRSLSSSS